jgi:hypothetical protein
VKIIITIVIFFISICLNAQTGSQNECRTNVELDVVIDTTYFKADTSKRQKEEPEGIVFYAGYLTQSYKLKALNDKFKIIGFRIGAESSNNDFVETIVEGNSLTGGDGGQVLSYAKIGTIVYIDCIKAKHENGKIYVLKPLSIRK